MFSISLPKRDKGEREAKIDFPMHEMRLQKYDPYIYKGMESPSKVQMHIIKSMFLKCERKALEAPQKGKILWPSWSSAYIFPNHCIAMRDTTTMN